MSNKPSKKRKQDRTDEIVPKRRVITELIDDNPEDNPEENSSIPLSFIVEKVSELINNHPDQELSTKGNRVFKKVKESIDKSIPTLEKIFTSALSHDDMIVVYQLYNLMIRCEKKSLEYFSYSKKINFILNNDKFNLGKFKDLKLLSSDKTKLASLYEKLFFQCLYEDESWDNIVVQINELICQEIEDPILLKQFEKDPLFTNCRNEIFALDTTCEIKMKIINLLNNSEDNRPKLYRKLPFNKIKSSSFNISEAYDLLNKELFGMDKVKAKVISILNDRNRNPDEPCIIALKGKPGTGKTSIAEAISKVLNLPFSKISMAGAEDASIITGSGPSWVGSGPSAIINELMKHGVANPVILLDEVDKICTNERGVALENSLLHLLDKTQNTKFNDLYLHEITHDMSKIFFILTMNNDLAINPILKDRLTIIDVPSYTRNELITITCDYIIPTKLKNKKLQDNIVFERCAIREICKLAYSNDDTSGIRSIQTAIDEIISSISLMNEGLFFLSSGVKVEKEKHPVKFDGYPFTVTQNHIQHFIEPKQSLNLSYIN